jgi:hypothetical protein
VGEDDGWGTAAQAQLFGRPSPSLALDTYVRTYADGLTPENVDEFVSGSSIVADEMEYTRPEPAVISAGAARGRRLTVIVAYNIGFGAYLTSFRPDGTSLEEVWGIPLEADLASVAAGKIPVRRQVARIPSLRRFAGGVTS